MPPLTVTFPGEYAVCSGPDGLLTPFPKPTDTHCMDWFQVPWPVVAAGLVGVVWLIYWMGGINEHRKTVTTFMKEIRADMKRIFDRLPQAPAGVRTGSPFSLTDFGQEMSKNMGAAGWAAEVAPTLRADLVGMQAFEVDAASRKYVQERMQEDPRVAKCMYEMGVERDNALNVLQVVLRDQLIAVLGISPTD